MKCDIKVCKNEATCSLALEVPGVGHSDKEPLRIVVGVVLCDQCFEIERKDPVRWLDIENEGTKTTLRSILAGVCVARRLVSPDFDLAKIKKVELSHPDWQQLQAARSTGVKGVINQE